MISLVIKGKNTVVNSDCSTCLFIDVTKICMMKELPDFIEGK